MNWSIHPIDLVVIALYLTGIFVVAYFSGRLFQTNESEDLISEQYLAGKSLTFWESLCSIIATEVSALTFLGIPAFAYDEDYSFLQIYIGAIVGRFIIAKYFLPRVYDKGLTIYETMASEKSTLGGRRATAIFYLLNKVLSVGVRLFSGSIMIAAFFNVNINVAILIICAVTFVYTLIGGLKAVVRTDMIQMGLFITGGIFAHYYIPHVNGENWSELMSFAFSHGKANIIDSLNPWAFVTGTVGGILFDMGTHGVDQDYVQRLTGNKSLKTAQKVIFLSSFFSILIGLLFLGIGSLLWAHYQTVTPPDLNSDQLFAHFITNYFPVGLKGLMVAGVLAATMSTLDSSINALSACFYNDIIHHRADKLEKMKSYYIRDTLFITFLLMVVAYISSHSDKLLILGLKIASWTGGSLLALFFSKILWKKWLNPRLDWFAVLGAYAVGIFTVYVSTFHLNFAWQWNVYLAFGTSIIYLWFYSKRKI